MEFRCGNRTQNQLHFQCFNSLHCAWDELQGDNCVCLEGWAHDFVGWGHFSNCALPAPFLLNFFIAYMVVSALFWPLAVYQMKTSLAKDKILYIGRACVGWSFTAWLNVLCTFIQGGFYEGALITWMMLATTGFALAAFTLPVLLMPVAHRMGSVRLAHRLAFVSNVFVTVEVLVIHVLGIIALHHVRDPNPDEFNKFMLVLLFQSDIALLLGSGTIFIVGNRLKRMLARIPGTAGIAKQLQIMMTFQVLLLTLSIVIICGTTLWFLFHSFPFMAVAWVLQNIILLLLLPLAIPLFSNYVAMGKSNLATPLPLSGSADIDVGSSEQRFHEPHVVVLYSPFSSLSIPKKTMISRINRKIGTPRIMTKISEKEESSAPNTIEFSKTDDI